MDLVPESFEGVRHPASRNDGDVPLHRVAAAQDHQTRHDL
jgi:hypothetical protein